MGNLRNSTIWTALPVALWEQYRDRLLGYRSKANTLQRVREWLAEQGVKASISMIHRDRRSEVAEFERVGAAKKMAEFTARTLLTEGVDPSEIALKVASQKAFDAVLNMDNLQPETVGQAIRLVETIAQLRAVSVKAEHTQLKMTQLREKFDRAAKTATGAEGTSGRLTAETISQIREAVFGSAA